MWRWTCSLDCQHCTSARMKNKMKNFLCLPLILLLFLLSCQPNQTTQQDEPVTPAKNENPDPAFILIPGKKVGKVSAEKCTRKDVLEAYGANAVVDSIYLGEGVLEEGVVLFPDDMLKRVEFFWDHTIDSLRPSFIRISGNEQGQTLWRTPEGISIGTPIAEVERINGTPFQIYGFGWDYGGLVNSWNGGKLPETLGLTFTYTASEVPEYLLGEVQLWSNDKSLLSVGPVVSVIVSSFRE